MERYRPRWIEEATQAEKIDSFAQLRKGTSIPVASGEHIQGRWEVYDYLKEGALSVVQCDPEWCGGTTELQKICTLASIFDVPVIPHGHSLHAALHLIASQSPAVCPLAEYLILKMRSYYHFEKHPPAFRRTLTSHCPTPPATESSSTMPRWSRRSNCTGRNRAATVTERCYRCFYGCSSDAASPSAAASGPAAWASLITRLASSTRD